MVEQNETDKAWLQYSQVQDGQISLASGEENNGRLTFPSMVEMYGSVLSLFQVQELFEKESNLNRLSDNTGMGWQQFQCP